MRSFQNDYRYGLDSEGLIHKTLEHKFGSLTKTGSYCPVDFEGTDWYIEVKTRRCTREKYPTTLLPYSKIVYAEKQLKPTYFIFVFTNGIFGIRYEKQRFADFTVQEFVRDYRCGIHDKKQPYLYIPVTELISLDNIPLPLPHQVTNNSSNALSDSELTIALTEKRQNVD